MTWQRRVAIDVFNKTLIKTKLRLKIKDVM